MANEAKVNSQRTDYDIMLPKWQRLRDCYDGRDAVLARGVTYVPDLPGASKAENDAYRIRGSFYNATKRTVTGMTGAVFQEAPEVDKFPKTFEDYLKDITLTGVPFEAFATDAGREVILMGRYGIMVDMPPVTVEGVKPRPYLCAYKAESIINWRTTMVDGTEVLTLVVMSEKVAAVYDPTDPFCSKVINQFRVLELKDKKATCQLWREATDHSKTYVKYEEERTLMRRGEALPFLPFYFIGALHATPNLELPPLLDLADVNLAHWRNSVDHEHGLHLVALPTPWVAGLKGGGGAASAPLKMGPAVTWELDLQGSAGFLEFSGAGLEALVMAMDEKKKQMATLGARLLEDTGVVQETATAVKMRHGSEVASLRTVAGSVELALTSVLQTLVWWTGQGTVPVDTNVTVELNKEYMNVKATAQEVQAMLTALQAGEISFETWWNFLSDGGWGREGIDAAAERKSIKEDEALDPEPVLDPTLSPTDPNNPQPGDPPKPKRRTVKDAQGNVKYQIEEN